MSIFSKVLDLQSEYVKIENSGIPDVDMTNWLLRDEADNRFYFPNLSLEKLSALLQIMETTQKVDYIVIVVVASGMTKEILHFYMTLKII